MLDRVSVACLLLVLAAGSGWAVTRSVPSTAYPTIQSAINAAVTGDVVVVAAGRYKENIDFKGKAITVRSSNPTSASVVAATIIDGDAYNHVVTFNHGEGRSSVLSGLTIRNGSAWDGGGGIYCEGTSPTITYNVITQNHATKYGGGIGSTTGSPLIQRNTISDNGASSEVRYASSHGGGISCEGGSPVILDNVIHENTTRNFGGMNIGSGGGICCASQATISGNTIYYNSCPYYGSGGGVVCGTGGKITNNVIFRNGSGMGGGGLYVSGSVTISNNLICRNTSGSNGGGIHFSDGTALISNNTLADNAAEYEGGGIYLSGCGASILNGNIITGSRYAGGIFVGYGTPPTVRYCDVWGNDDDNYGADTGIVWADQTGLRGNISVDPQFADANSSNYLLRSKTGRWNGSAWVNDTVTSPCIDAGDPAFAFAKEPAPNGGRINMGHDGNTMYASKSPGTNHPPTTPTAVTISPFSPGPENLTGKATGSTDPDGDTVTYVYQWSKRNLDGTTWGAWANPTSTLAASKLKIGDVWRVRAKAYDGQLYSAYKTGSSATVVSMAYYTPKAGTTNVPATTSVYLDFRWAPVQSTVPGRVKLMQGTTVVPVTVSWVTFKKIKLTPKARLGAGKYYRIYVSTGIKCTSGRGLNWGESHAYFVTATAKAPAAVSVAAAPTAVGAQVTVNLSAAATVQTVICNIAGRVVAELPERDLPAGVSSLIWNGKGNSGTRVPSGSYLVRVEAKGEEGTQASAVGALRMW